MTVSHISCRIRERPRHQPGRRRDNPARGDSGSPVDGRRWVPETRRSRRREVSSRHVTIVRRQSGPAPNRATGSPTVQSVGRNPSYLDRAHAPAGRWRDRYFCEWGIVVGDRVRRTRVEQGLRWRSSERSSRSPKEVATAAGTSHASSAGGRARRSTCTSPSRKRSDLCPDGCSAHKPVSEAEMTLLNVLRELSISPSEAIVVLTADARPDGAPAQSM